MRFLLLGLVAATTLTVSSPHAQGGAQRAFSKPTLSQPGLILLPPGFRYRVVAGAGTLYSDGTLRPGDVDGMAVFPGPNGTTLLCVNHELSNNETPVVPPVAGHYDPASRGGTSVMQVSKRRKLLSAWISSSGTIRNCSGGTTPWNTWITAEENFSVNGSFSHGWAFEVDPYAPLGGGTPRQVRLDPLGRFYREAVSVDPATGAVYQTEDRTDSLLYRFLPSGPLPTGYGDYATLAGTLQAAYIPGLPNADNAEQGDTFAPQWVTVPDPDGTPIRTRQQDYLDGQGASIQPTRFYRGEGSAWSEFESALYFDATGGGSSSHVGQIWRYEPLINELKLVFESHDESILDNPDNLVVLPNGALVICEDGGVENHLRILTLDGTLVDFATTTVSELTGVSWDASTDTLFVNLQVPNITLAIWGPWSLVGG